ncbi:MAG: DUF2817 domain-containing protein [Planctomycetota bacterium]
MFLAAVAAGCASAEIHFQGEAAIEESRRVTDLGPVVREHLLGDSVEGRPLVLREIGTGPEVVLLLASIHGEEPAGTALLQRLERHLLEHSDLLDGRTVLLLPEANPDGLAAGRRFNARGVDLNRNFPAANRRERRRSGPEPLSEPESRVLARLIEDRKPVRVLSIHQPLRCVDWDGPSKDLARAVAEAAGLPARKIGAMPGSLGSWVGVDRETPLITLELLRGAERLSVDERWTRWGEALVVFVRGR